MAVKPWRATSIQMRSERATQAPDNEAARAVIKRNLDRLLGLIQQACASNEKPDLVVFPEFALQGPPLSMKVGPWIERACSTIPGPLTEPLQALAKREGIYIAGNMFEAPGEWPGRYFNSSFLIGRDGEIVVNYRRVNTAAFPSVHDFMSDYLDATPEDQVFPIADTELGRLALIPCGEINVPEVARCYMISANVAGPIGFSPDNSIVGGRSHILDHFGDTIAFEESAEEGIGVSGIIDIEKLRSDRRTDTGTHNPLLRARFEMYRPYYQQAAFYPPDHFLDAPMADAAETKAAVDISRTNLERARVLEPLSER